MAVNAGALLALSNKNLFGDDLVLHSCEQNLEISRTLLARLPAEARLYAGEAEVDARHLGLSYRTLAAKEAAAAALRGVSADEARRDAEKAIQLCNQWQSECTSQEKTLVTMHLADCERIAAVAYWQAGEKLAAINAVDLAMNTCLRLLSNSNRDSVRVKLAELAQLKAKMLRKMHSHEVEKQDAIADAIAAMLVSAPATAPVEALRAAILAPPPTALWSKLRTGRSITDMIANGRLAAVELYLQELKRFDDERGRGVTYDVAVASTIEACAKQQEYDAAGRLSAMLEERFQKNGDAFARAKCNLNAAMYFLEANRPQQARVQFERLVGYLAQASTRDNRWRELCNRALSLSFEIVAREKLSGMALVNRLALLRKALINYHIVDEKTVVFDSLFQSGLQTALFNGEMRDLSQFSNILSTKQMTDTYADVANRLVKARKSDSAVRLLKECERISLRTGMQPTSQLINELDEYSVKLMLEGKYGESSAFMQQLAAVEKDVNPYRAVRQSVCQYVLEGSSAGEAACSRILSAAKSDRERSLMQQTFLDLLQEHLTREKETEGLRSLCLPYDKNLDVLKDAWGAASDQYAGALLQCAALHEKLRDFQTATTYLHKCTDVLKGGANPQLSRVLQDHLQNCATNLSYGRSPR